MDPLRYKHILSSSPSVLILLLFTFSLNCPSYRSLFHSFQLFKLREHTTMSNLSLTKELKIYDGEIAASSTKTAGKTG
jgi:hypothetical protein